MHLLVTLSLLVLILVIVLVLVLVMMLLLDVLSDLVLSADKTQGCTMLLWMLLELMKAEVHGQTTKLQTTTISATARGVHMPVIILRYTIYYA